MPLCYRWGDFHVGEPANLARGEWMARADLAVGDAEQVAAWKARATVALEGIADKDDRDLIEGDLATLP